MNKGKGNAILHKAQSVGATGGTILYGEGTKQSRLIHKLSPARSHKEIVMISANHTLCSTLHETLFQSFKMHKRGRGILFSVPFAQWNPINNGETASTIEPIKYSCIFVIVDRGKSDACIKAARSAGAKGGTVVHGHGAGVPADFYFPLVIEPQKDVVFILTPKANTAATTQRITADLALTEPGNGILFVLPVIRTNGLVENRMAERSGGAV